MTAIEQLQEIQTKLEAIAPDLCRDAHADCMIAAHHLSKVIKEESGRLNRQQKVKKKLMLIPPVIDTKTIKKADIKRQLVHDEGILEVILHNGNQFYLQCDAAIAFQCQIEGL